MSRYYAIGSTLAGLVNMSTYFRFSPRSVRSSQPTPLMGGVRRRALSGIGRADGFINSSLTLDFASQAQYEAFVYAVFGGFTTASIQRYFTLFDVSGHFSPYLGYIEQPTMNWETSDALTNLVFPLSNLVLQSATKTSGYTVTTSDRLLYANTSGGSITFALPAVAGVVANTVFSFVKTSASNTMTLDPNASETINGASTYAVTANYSRVDVYSNGSQWIVL